MSDEDEDECSKTILGAAVRKHIPIDDDVIKLAKEVERQKKKTLWFKFKQELLARVQMIATAALTAITAACIYFFDWIREMMK